MSAQRLTVILAAGAAVIGWLLLAYTVFGPTYSTLSTEISSDGSTVTSSGNSSILAMGISPLLAIILIGFAACYAGVLGGALLLARGAGRGRWLMLICLLPMIAVNSISFGLATLMPATLLAAAATVSGWMAQPGSPPTAPRS